MHQDTSMVALRSDNTAGVSPEILAAIADVADADMAPYGDDPVTLGLDRLFSDLFSGDCTVAPVGTGIAANALGLSLIAGPLDSAIAHADAHVTKAEAGAFEFFTQGGRLIALDHLGGRLDATLLDEFLTSIDRGQSGVIVPRAVSITQPTERGIIYPLDDVRRLSEVAHRHGLRLHMDGARIANAIATLGCTPAETTARAGVDVLSFGATKNGTMNADAVVVFDRALTASLTRRRRRSGQLTSKMRFLSAQLQAYVRDGLWLRNADHANRSARYLAGRLEGVPGVTVVEPVEINMVFARIDHALLEQLGATGIGFRRVERGPSMDEVRMVTSFSTSAIEIDRIVNALRLASAAGAAGYRSA